MPVHVDRVLSEVVPEAEPAAGRPETAAAPWEEAERLRALLAREEWDRMRTRAEGYDD
jgi:hypothetical protein